MLFYKDNLYLIEFPYHQVQEQYVDLKIKQITHNGNGHLKKVINAFDIRKIYELDDNVDYD